GLRHGGAESRTRQPTRLDGAGGVEPPMPANLWDDAAATRQPALDGLVYRSTLLARDRSVVNIYGGNTSAKLTGADHVGRSVDLLWVKGSGGDMAASPGARFAGLRLGECVPRL